LTALGAGLIVVYLPHSSPAKEEAVQKPTKAKPGGVRLKEIRPERREAFDLLQSKYSDEFDRRYEEHKARERQAESELHDFRITH
jgi:hypothetical protein